MTRYPKVETRITTPSGRYAVIKSYDADDRVHVRYFDEEGGEACFPAKLIRDCDILPKPNTHVDPERKGFDVDERSFWGSGGRTLPKYEA